MPVKSKSLILVCVLALSLAVPATASASFNPTTYRTNLLHYINQYRAMHGRHALVVNAHLQQAAQAHSTNMATHHLFSHYSYSGVNWAQRIRWYGFRGRVIGENLAVGQIWAATTLRMWANSAPHRYNLLYAPYRYIGIGVVRGTWNGRWAFWVTADFGTP
jgi:uncharacterized protein YkwD